jgi:hypothetical protein
VTERGSGLLQNGGYILPDYMVSHPRKTVQFIATSVRTSNLSNTKISTKVGNFSLIYFKISRKTRKVIALHITIIPETWEIHKIVSPTY